jgi:sensor histidine kinase YesM
MITPVIALSLNVTIQVMIFHFISRLSLLRSILLGFVTGLIFLITFSFYLFSPFHLWTCVQPGIFLTNLMTYIALSYGYFHFVNLGETARRIRLLREIYNERGGITNIELVKRYNSKKMLELRINRLLSKGQITARDNRYFIQSRLMLIITRVIVNLKWIIIGKKSEFD